MSTPTTDLPPSSRLGLALFTIYCVAYAGFMALVCFAPTALRQTPLLGVNLAIWYGFGLIAGALLLALIYLAVRRDEPEAGRTGSAP